MASTASPSSSSSTAVLRPQAGPLPPKVGELGYPQQHTPPSLPNDDTTSHDDHQSTHQEAPASPRSSLARTTSVAASSTHGSTAPSTTTTTAATTVSDAPTKPRAGFFARLFGSSSSSKSPTLILGLTVASLLRFAILLGLLGGTLGGWICVIRKLNAQASASSSSDSPPATNPDGTQQEQPQFQIAGAMFIFIHVAFALALIILLVFLERALFQLRAERWRHTHPGETLPQWRNGSGGRTRPAPPMSLAPWNRPPLPTYAAALGARGTGDVEDDAIAAPPPPAYGNTRGSTLLLATALRNSLRRGLSATASPTAVQEVPTSRPVSYQRSNDEEEVRQAAARARDLEATLARLEEGTGTPSSSSR